MTFRLLRRRFEVWTYISRNGEAASEPRLVRRCWTRRGAETWGESVTKNPETFAASLESVERLPLGGHMLFAEYEVRRAS